MTRHTLKPLVVAVGLALTAPAFAVNLDFTGSNIYMKFLDGNQRTTSPASGDTASGADQGQWTEFELNMKATISRQVEAGVRLQSRSPAAYWTNFGFANNEGFGGPNDQIYPQQSKFVKLRGAYVQLTPGYNWLDQARIGSSDWGSFDPFTVGKVRYIDRDNYNGLYFKGPVYGGGSYEFARVSLPNYLQFNYGQGPSCCSSDATQYNEGVYVFQYKHDFKTWRLAGSYQHFEDDVLDSADTNPLDGTGSQDFGKNQVLMLKAEGSVLPGVDVRGAYYKSKYKAPLFDQPWIGNPKSSINDDAFKIDIDVSSLPVPGLTFNFQYFDIGAGYYSNLAARRESDILLSEGSESAWYNWGQSLWLGGAAKEYQQGAATPKCQTNVGGRCNANPGLQGGANGITDNDFMDFDEPPAESALGWKGFTLLAAYEFMNTPMTFEYTNLDYNYNWRNYSPTGPLSNFYKLNQDRKTSIYVFRASHVVQAFGGIELGFKWKMVDDKDNAAEIATAPALVIGTRETEDNGYSFAVGNQLFSHLYGQLSWGSYSRDIKFGPTNYDNDKDIWSLKFAYNLAGLEIGALAQWIDGRGDPTQSGTQIDFKQYRMKTFVKAIF
jgi:hypothetical protein